MEPRIKATRAWKYTCYSLFLLVHRGSGGCASCVQNDWWQHVCADCLHTRSEGTSKFAIYFCVRSCSLWCHSLIFSFFSPVNIFFAFLILIQSRLHFLRLSYLEFERDYIFFAYLILIQSRLYFAHLLWTSRQIVRSLFACSFTFAELKIFKRAFLETHYLNKCAIVERSR